MSQFYLKSNGGTGPLPPTVPTSFKVDLQQDGSLGGTVVPNNNSVNVFGNPSDPFGTMGIVTKAIQTNVPNDTIYIAFVDGKTITSDAAVTPIITLIITDNSSFTITALATAYDTASGNSFGARLLVIGSNTGGVTNIEAVLEKISGGLSPLNDCALNATVSGANLIFTVQGVAGRTIKWHVILPGIAAQT